MFGVVQIISFPLVDRDGNVIGLVSIDSKEKVRLTGNNEGGEANSVEIDSSKLTAYLEAMQTTLARVEHASRRN